MSAQDKPLVKAQGAIAPQHFNPVTGEFEYAEGVNGASKVEVVNTQIEVTNLPTVQQVNDGEVLAELKSLNANNQMAISAYDKALNAETVAGNAVTKATIAESKVDTVRSEFDQVVAEAGSNNPEVVNARGTFTNLKQRLDSTAQQLADTASVKISRGEVTINDIDKNKGKFDQTFMTEGFLEQIVGSAPINSVPENKSVTKIKLADKAVDPLKTTMFNSTNMFNKRSIQIGKSMDTSGNIIDEGGRWLSDLIEVNPGQTLYISTGSFRVQSYDNNFLPIGSRQSFSSGTITSRTEGTTTYLRISGTTGQNVDEIMLNTGSVLLPFEPYGKLKTEYLPEVEKFKLTDKIIEPKHVTFFSEGRNLLNPSEFTDYKTVDLDGSIIDDAARWLSGYIKVSAGEMLHINVGQYRLAYYDTDKKFISRSGTTTSDFTVISLHTVAFVKVNGLYSNEHYPKIMMNRGSGLLPYEKPEEEGIKLEYIPIKAIKEAILNELPANENSKYDNRYPIPARIRPDIRSSANKVPLWLAEDGQTLYGQIGSSLLRSTDNWDTTTTVHSFDGVGLLSAVRDLRNGEVIVCQDRHDGSQTKARIWVSENYSDPEAETTWTQVLEGSTQSARFTNYWGISVYDNIVFLSEYGNRGEAGKAYLSLDYGKTFKVAYDLYADPSTPDIPEAHIHSSAYDPYWNRFWITNGDATNSATLYSDDFCETWTHIDSFNMRQGTDKDAFQFVTIIPMPNCVLFASDRSRMAQGYAPNGIYRLERTEHNRIDATYEDIEIAYQFDDSADLTYMGRLGFQRFGKDEPMYITAGKPGGSPRSNPGVVLATFDGYKFHNIYTDTDGEGFGTYTFVGPTNDGKLIGTMHDTRQVAMSVFTADTQVWKE